MAFHNQLGKWGEDIAAQHLTALGCAIRDQNWRMGHYEIDIVAMQGTTIIFCEVKTRSNPDDDPLDAVDDRRIAHMAASAQVYMETFNLNCLDVRFDLFGIRGTPDTGYQLEYIPDAFDVPLSTY